MDDVAVAITDAARTQPYPTLRYVPGTVWETTVCNEFNWLWLCFPAALIALAALALASITSATVPHDGEPPVWKSSILPLLDGRVIGSTDYTPTDSLDEMA
jgi:hypothetical protein